MRRSVPCVLAVFLICLALLPGQVQAQTGINIVEENVVLTRTNYPSVRPSEGSVRIYAGEWTLKIKLHDFEVWKSRSVTIRTFLDNVLVDTELNSGYQFSRWEPSFSILFSNTNGQRVSTEVWVGDETQPQDTYSFNVLVVKPEVSGLQASSKVVRALGENSLGVSFTNGGNENMRQAVLSVADSGGLTITPNEVELGDVNPGEQVSASFAVSSPASVTLGTTQIRFSLSFIDYAGVSHEEDVYGEVEVCRLTPTLTVTAPSSVENGATVEILAVLKDPEGNPIADENITLTVGGVELGTFKTDSNGAARASYRATETGTFDVGASFLGSASYETSSASAGFEVTPAAAFPYWVLLLIALLVVSAAVLAVWKGKQRRAAQPARKARTGAAG